MPNKSTKFQIVLPPTDRKRLENLSESDTRPMSDIVKISLKILEGIRKGKFILTTPDGNKMPSSIAI